MKNRKLARHAATPRIASLVVAMIVLSLTACGLAEDEPRSNLKLDEDVQVRIQELGAFCSVELEGYGTVDVEEDYLPSVIACENGDAPMEALKAQAVAARTYAYFITKAENRPLATTTDDQVYDCEYADVEDRHIQAVQETAGQVLMHGDQLIASFYVAGSIPSASSCVAGSGDSDPTTTENYVTYNQGRVGSAVKPTSLGHPDNPANRGAKSQNGATCLADAGWDHERILRFYYGDDARVRVSEESQCAGAAPDGGDNPAPTGDVCGISSGTDDGPSCADPSQKPNIQPRSAWNARTPSANRSPHTPNRISVHHTVSPNNEADGAHWVNQVQRWHMGQGWSDIGYHFLIAWDGTIYRGNPEDRMGAHVGGDNTGNLGIALLGTFHQSTAPSDAQTESLTRMLRHLGDKYGIDLNRNTVKGHGERPGQSTQCPGGQVLSQLDTVVDKARADAVCREPADDGGTTDVDEYRYVRVSGASDDPSGEDDIIDGYEVDSIYFERGGQVVLSDSVLCSPGVSNPIGALGRPDNNSCDDRSSTVAGVPSGSDLVVELDEPLKVGDNLHVTQHSYNPAWAECGPSGTAKIAVSEDGVVWKVLDSGNSGNWNQVLTDDDFVIDEDDELMDGESGFEFIAPKAGQAYKPNVTFRVKTNHPDIVEVEYYVPDDAEDVIDEDWKIGSSTTRSDNYEVEYEIQYYGERVVAARGLNSAGEEVVSKEITITVTDFDGVIPEGETENTSLGGADFNQTMANSMATEAGKCYDPAMGGPRCSSTSNGYSIGYCWRFVKRALERAGIPYQNMQNTGPCTAYRFQMSAFGFRCNADPNPSALAQVGLQKVDIATTDAPPGALIVWDKGCNGYNSTHGHIEIVNNEGEGCSDFCGTVKPDAACASVYVPIN